MVGGYAPDDLARRVDEPSKRGQFAVSRSRPPFARDRARVLHSSAFRRLADKTQVVDPGGGFGGDGFDRDGSDGDGRRDDFPRTRLTHSLEVAQIAREIGSALGCDPDIVDTAGLAHDLGHPPFGHTGEYALNQLSVDIGGFEGNAQTLRILTRLEPKIADADGRPAGLNLTRASLDATTKYPWRRSGGPEHGRARLAANGLAANEDQPIKFGVYDDDLPAFEWYRAGVPAGARCIEAQVMDWADDVAYSVHDLEDGVHAGQIRLAEVDASERKQVCAVAAQLYTSRPAEELGPVLDQLLALPTLVDLHGFDGSHATLAAAKRATSELTGRFAGAAVAATRQTAGVGPLTRYDADLVVPAQIAAECALLKALAAYYVMRRPGAQERRAAQRALLTELVEALVLAAPSALDVALRPAWLDAHTDGARLRAVIDQVAQLTDSGAFAWHRRLVRPS